MNSLRREEIEEATRTDKELWQEIRKNRITASNVGSIAKTRNITSADKWKKPVDISYVPAIRWGVLHECDAIEAYKTATGNTVQQCGIFISPVHDWLAGTPDGVVQEREVTGIIETKCPYSIRDYKPEDCFKKLVFLHNDGTLRKTHNYYYQIQIQLHATGYNWCDFVVWTLKGVHIQRITRDESFLAQLLPKLHSIHQKHW